MISRNFAILLGIFIGSGVAFSEEESPASHKVIEFEDLEGWNDDDHRSALNAFLVTCPDLDEMDWASLCALAQQKPDAKSFFELFFRPMLIEDGKSALFTGYFEPELSGSLRPSARFRYPVYAQPPESRGAGAWYTREQIETNGVMLGRGLELAWVDDPVELFFMHIQGSGRIRLQDGKVMRVGYAGKNGHEYRSVGKELVRRGVYEAHQVSAQVIKNWVRRNPGPGQSLLWHNPSYVFFRRIDKVPSELGPLGAMNRPVTAGRTIAADPAFVPLGAPVWIEKDGAEPVRRLMVAQDTGSAINGAQRADIFIGSGDQAGRVAGMLMDPGRMVVLMPIQRAYSMETGP